MFIMNLDQFCTVKQSDSTHMAKTIIRRHLIRVHKGALWPFNSFAQFFTFFSSWPLCTLFKWTGSSLNYNSNASSSERLLASAKGLPYDLPRPSQKSTGPPVHPTHCFRQNVLRWCLNRVIWILLQFQFWRKKQIASDISIDRKAGQVLTKSQTAVDCILLLKFEKSIWTNLLL